MSFSDHILPSIVFNFILLLQLRFRYEGTGRSLSLKLIENLRQCSVNADKTALTNGTSESPSSRVLVELALNESIRYSVGDPVEIWLNKLLCLDATVVPRISSGCPMPDTCDLYPLTTSIFLCSSLLYP